MSEELLVARLNQLERSVRRQRFAVAAMAVVTLSALAMPTSRAEQAASDAVRTRSLVIEDAQGRARILMGAPLPGAGGQPRTGIRIADPNGDERLGLNLFDDGRIVVGLDAPRGAGDDRNRERINFIADANGGSSIVFKDRRTYVVGRMHLDPSNQLWLDFTDYMSTPNVTRRIGIKGDEMLR
jgi:hypothetical protein